MPEKKTWNYKGKKRGIKSKAPDDKILLKKFETMTREELGKEYGVAGSTIGVWLRKARDRQGVK